MRYFILLLFMFCFLIPPAMAGGAYGDGGEPNGSGSSSNR